MFDKDGFHLLDYLDFLVKRKQLFIIIFFSSLILSYVAIFILVEEQYEATATIIPSEDETSSLTGGLLASMKKMPFNLGTKSLNSEVDIYKTIIFSRTMLEDVIKRFGLIQIYKLDTMDAAHMEKAVKRLQGEIRTKETEESAFIVSVRANMRETAAEMTNYIVSSMNERIIHLKTSRSRDSKEFLQKRVKEITTQLRNSEDSLRAFQERSGLLDVKSQLQGIISAHTILETEITGKRVQLGILERIYDKNSSQVKELNMQIQEYEKRLMRLRSQGDPGSPLLALKKLPRASVDFLRLYREVELNNMLLEFVVPLYEQSKIEEKKDYPVLQVIDYAVPPAKKSFPPRTLFALIGALSITLLVLISTMIRKSMINITDPRWLSILKDMKHWSWNIHKLK
ncbi:MAG: hypothetical protein C0417_02520 [Chlorobiaceae bacterium]|nr:hypothetical protein [Chlorobiaceae bacterium]